MLAGWGWAEWVLVLVIVLIIFGVGRLPEIGGALGKTIREFRSESKGDPEVATPEEKEMIEG